MPKVKPAVFQNGGIGREYNLRKLDLGLEKGGGIGREAVLGGAVLGGSTVLLSIFGQSSISRTKGLRELTLADESSRYYHSGAGVDELVRDDPVM